MPIVDVHLWYDRKVMSEPFLTLLDHTTQWVFNKSELSARDGETRERGGSQYLQLVISASYDLVPKSRQEIIDLCVRELADVPPVDAAPGAVLGQAGGPAGLRRPQEVAAPADACGDELLDGPPQFEARAEAQEVAPAKLQSAHEILQDEA